MTETGGLWAIVLAAGEGSRMAKLTRAMYGKDMPKQFAALDADETFLQRTVERVLHLVPAERTVVVVAEPFEDLAREQLARWPQMIIVPQPRNVGTLPGLLLPLAHVLARDPHARVAVFPSDHHVREVGPFVEAVRRAIDCVGRVPARLVLVGARADRPATDLGWVQGGRVVARGARIVQRFVEKPPQERAAALLATGALWNTLVFAGDGDHIWDLARRARPDVVAAMDGLRDVPHDRARSRAIYARLPVADFSRQFLERIEGLGVVEMADAGWSDCGTPERLLQCLEGTQALRGLMRRLKAKEGSEVLALAS